MFVLLLTAPETVGIIRDITVIAFLALAFLVVFVGSVLGVILYRRLAQILRRADRTLGTLERTMESIEGAADATRSAASAVRTGLTSGFGVTNVVRSLTGTLIGRRWRGGDRRRSRDD